MHHSEVRPNAKARKNKFRKGLFRVYAEGYQSFSVHKRSHTPKPTQKNTKAKDQLLRAAIFENVSEKSFMDIGCNTGYFNYLASAAGALQSHGIDMDAEAIAVARAIKQSLGMENISFEEGAFSEITASWDVVLALSLIHWIYSRTEEFGALRPIIERFAGMTKELLIIEWVDPSDHKIMRDGHTRFNEEVISEAYTRENFLNALWESFSSVERYAQSTPTREIYFARK